MTLARHRLVAGEGVEDEAGQARREHGVAAVDTADRVVEVGGGDRLGDVAPGTGTNDPDHVVGSVGHRERQEPSRQLVGGDAFDDCPSAAARQVDVEENDVGRVRRMTSTASSTDPASPTTSIAGSDRGISGPVSSARTPARISSWSSTRTSLIGLLTHLVMSRAYSHDPSPRQLDLDLGALAGSARDRRPSAGPLDAGDDRVGDSVAVGRHAGRVESTPVSRTKPVSTSTPTST